MDYAALKADYVAAGKPTDLATAVKTLGALTVTTPRDAASSDIILLLCRTGEWAGLVYAAQRGTVSDLSPQPAGTYSTKAATAAAGFVSMLRDLSTIPLTDAALLTSIQAQLVTLRAAGLLAQGTIAALAAMNSAAVAKYPGLTAGDIQTAGAQP